MRVLAVDAIAPEGLAYLRENLVNARLVAAERGVGVRIERRSETSGYTSVLSLATQTRGGRKITAGTVFDG